MNGQNLVCPVCMTVYGYGVLKSREGQVCGDLSQGQEIPCPGRLIKWEKLAKARWTWLDRWTAGRLPLIGIPINGQEMPRVRGIEAE